MAEIIRIPGEGEVIGGQFVLGKELGRGGYGVVFEAIQTGVERTVAVKMLLPKALEEQQEGVVERFKREARLASSLTHPSAVTIYAFGVYQPDQVDAVGLPYIAMEYLHGESLQDYLMRRGPLPPDEVEEIIAEVLGSLAEAHRKGIIHRDIKPDNVFLHRPPGEPQKLKVLDFGISMAITAEWGEENRQRLTQTGLVTGTAEYMAPEQVMGSPEFTPAIDVYAMGCMAYQLLTGRFPYQGSTPVEIAIRHIYDPIPDLPGPIKGTHFGNVLERSLHKDPQVRFGDAGAMLEALTSGQLPALPEGVVVGPAAEVPAGHTAPAPGAPQIGKPLPPPSSRHQLTPPPSGINTPPPLNTNASSNNNTKIAIGVLVAAVLLGVVGFGIFKAMDNKGVQEAKNTQTAMGVPSGPDVNKDSKAPAKPEGTAAEGKETAEKTPTQDPAEVKEEPAAIKDQPEPKEEAVAGEGQAEAKAQGDDDKPAANKRPPARNNKRAGAVARKGTQEPAKGTQDKATEPKEQPAAQADPEPVKEEPKPVVKEEPKVEPKAEPKPVVKEEPKPVVKEAPTATKEPPADKPPKKEEKPPVFDGF